MALITSLKSLLVNKSTSSKFQHNDTQIDTDYPINIETIKVVFQDKNAEQKLIFIAGWSRIEPQLSLGMDFNKIIFTPKYRTREDLEKGNLEFSGHFIIPSSHDIVSIRSGSSIFRINVAQNPIENNLKTAHMILIEMFKNLKANFLLSEVTEVSNWLVNSYLPLIKYIHIQNTSHIEITQLGLPASDSLEPTLVVVLSNIWEALGHIVLAAKEKSNNIACLVPHSLTAQEKIIFEGIAKSYGISVVVVSRTSQNLLNSLFYLKSQIGFSSCNIRFNQSMNLQKFQVIAQDDACYTSGRENELVKLNFADLDLNCANYIGDFLSKHTQIAYLADRFSVVEQKFFLRNLIIENVECHKLEELALSLIQQEEKSH